MTLCTHGNIHSHCMTCTDNERRNWTEDASHENGNYQCQCVHCGHLFVGHKRRVICKLCENSVYES